MTRKTSSHLRIHTEDSDGVQEAAAGITSPIDLLDLVDVFSKATGWIPRPIARTPHADLQQGEAEILPPLRKRIRLVSAAPIDGMLDSVEAENLAGITSEEEAWALLEKLDVLVQQLRSAEGTIELQEAQLASGIGVSVRKDEAELLTARLLESLGRATEQTGSDAAAIYLLDETTSQLKMRSCFG
ncbi:MAG: hypothetical protein AAGG44_18400, partial [Planctomycetota bacterium]